MPDVGSSWTVAAELLTAFALKAVGAIVVWILGRWLIGFAVSLISRALQRQHFDPTLLRYVANIVTVSLNVILVVAILGYFGVETTSFAALVAAMGVAIGAAWGGLLANFAAGAFLIVLRPFKLGDYVSAGGIEGTVTEIGLFATTINTPDNVQTQAPGRRDPRLHGDGAGVFRASVHAHRPLLAGLLRDQRRDRGHVRHGGLPGAGVDPPRPSGVTRARPPSATPLRCCRSHYRVHS